MHDLLSKYLTGDISSEEKQTLFLLLKENTELKKEAADLVFSSRYTKSVGTCFYGPGGASCF